MPIAAPFVKPCPKCRSEKTEYMSSGWQRFLTMATGFHNYRCLACGHKFRAGDRRRFPRSGQGAGVDYKR